MRNVLPTLQKPFISLNRVVHKILQSITKSTSLIFEVMKNFYVDILYWFGLTKQQQSVCENYLKLGTQKKSQLFFLCAIIG